MQSSDTSKKGKGLSSSTHASDTMGKQDLDGGGGTSSGNMYNDHSNSTAAQDNQIKSKDHSTSKQSPDTRKRNAAGEGRSHSSKSPKKSHDSSPSLSQSSSTSQRTTSSPRSTNKHSHTSPRKSSSLDAAQGSPSTSKRASSKSPHLSPSLKAVTKSDDDISEDDLHSMSTSMGNDSVEEVDASLSAASSSNTSFGAVEAEPSSNITARRRYSDPPEEDSSGDLSLSSTTQPQSLSATVSRGAFHQCGTARRVKVYELKGETWFDRGTGYCAGVYDEQHDAALLVARMEEGCRKLTVVPDGMGDDSDGVEDRPSVAVESSTNEETQIGTEGKEDREHFMLVVSESLGNEELLLKTRVVKEDVYQRQQDTLVVWTEPDGTDMALSFQEADGCHEVWEFLTEVQKHFILNARQAGEVPSSMDDGEGEGMTSGALGVSNTNVPSDGELVMSDGSSFNLPNPNMDSLEVIDLTLKDAASRSPQAREKVAEWILREDYLLRLLPVFQDAEDLEQLEELHRLCSIMHTILMLNDSVLVERILQEDVFLGAMGMLEYDPEFPRLKASYRDYLLHTTKFRQVVDIHDASILSKIHQTFRLQYLKDVVLARILDDSTFAVLNSLIFYHQADIVAFCTSSEIFLSSLFQIFDKSKVESEEKKAEAIIFLQQLCAMGKQVQLPSRIALYRTLTEWGLLIVLEYALTRTEAKLRNAAAEILMTITEYDAMGVRVHVLEQVDKNATPLITKLSDILHEGHGDLGLKTQIAESLRILFDSGPDGSSGGPNVAQTLAAAAAAAAAASDGGRSQKDDTDRFLNWFYDGEVDHLFSPLKNLTPFKDLSQQMLNSRRATIIDLSSPAKSALFNHLCELLTFIMVHHHFRSQYWVISSDISMRVASLLFAREKHLRLTALRFFRACLAKGNQFVNRHFLKIELVSAVLAVVEGEASRDNLVTSACLEFFEHIRKENIRSLIANLMERHESRVQALTENEAIGHYFRALILQWEKNIEPPPSSFHESESSMASVHLAEKERRIRDIARRGDNRAMMDSDEENYFNEDEDEEAPPPPPISSSIPNQAEIHQVEMSGESVSSIPPTLALVNYPVDDDDDDDDDDAAGGGGDLIDSVSDGNQWNNTTSLQDQEATTLPIQSLEPIIKRKKRGADEDEDEDGDDMMGRLVKRKTSTIHESNQDTEGGFIKDDSDNATKSKAANNNNNNITGAAKKVTITLSAGSENQFKKDNE